MWVIGCYTRQSTHNRKHEKIGGKTPKRNRKQDFFRLWKGNKCKKLHINLIISQINQGESENHGLETLRSTIKAPGHQNQKPAKKSKF